MAISIGALFLGLLLLYLGAEWMVKGAAGLAREYGVAPLVVGLTVVAYGTSAPELVVSAVAAFGGDGDIALGNAIGSNVANLGLILGVTALVQPIAVQAGLMRRELPVLILSTAALPLLLVDGEISRADAALLFAASIAFTFITVRTGSAPRARETAALVEADAELAGAPAGGGRLRLALIAAVGLALLVGGGKIFVMGASDLALRLGMSQRTVGLTIVAVGTSMPELAASVIAAVRGHSAIAVGNVIGSNVFNVLFALGGASLLRPIQGSVVDLRVGLVALGFMTAAAILLLSRRRTMSRYEGGLLAAGYLAFLAVIAIGA